MGRHLAKYWRCAACEFWGTDEPTWLVEAYDTPIASADTGLVSRNVFLARAVFPVLATMTDPRTARYVDWAGGCGLFVRMMRDKGLNFEWQDDYAENILARLHTFEPGGGTVAAATAFEVMEHVPDPMPFLRNVLDQTKSKTFIFTTELHDGTYDRDWWYLAPRTGQHVSFYSRTTLGVIAEQLGMQLRTSGSIHMFTQERISQRRFASLIKYSRILTPILTRRLDTLVTDDHQAALATMSAD